MSKFFVFLAMLFTVCFSLNIPLEVSNWADVTRNGDPVTAGVPLPQGTVTDLTTLRMVDGSGNTVPAQFKAMSKWWWEKNKDGVANPSIKWVLCDFQAAVMPSKDRANFTLRDDNTGGTPSSPLSVTDASDNVTVSTGPLVFVVSKTHFNLFDNVSLNGQTIIASNLQNGGSITAGDWTSGGCNAGTVHTSTLNSPQRVVIQEQGPMKVVIMVEGRHYATVSGVSKGLYGYQAFITAYAGKPYVDVQWLLTNTFFDGAPPQKQGYAWPFSRYSLNFNLNLNLASQQYSILGKNEVSGTLGTDSVRLLQKQANYTITGAASDSFASGGAQVSDGSLGMRVAIRDFALNCPKGITIAKNLIFLDLFPDTGSATRYWIDPMARKNHRMRFEFFSGAPATGDLLALSKKTGAPLRMLASPSWYRSTRAWERGFGLPPRDQELWRRRAPADWTRLDDMADFSLGYFWGSGS